MVCEGIWSLENPRLTTKCRTTDTEVEERKRNEDERRTVPVARSVSFTL